MSIRELAIYYLKRIYNTEVFEHREKLLREHQEKHDELSKKMPKKV